MYPALLVSDLQEAARRLQAQAGHLQHQLRQSPVDLRLVVQTLAIIEDTAHETLVTFHQHASTQWEQETRE